MNHRCTLLLAGLFVCIVADQGTSQEPYQQWLSYMEGRWQFEQSDGETGSVTFRKVGTQDALTLHGVSENFSIAGIIGWRPESKTLVETDYYSESTGKGVDDRTLQVISAEVIRGTSRFSHTNGDRGEQTLEYKKISANEMTLHGSGGAQPWTVRFTRDVPAAHLAVLEPFIGSWKYDGPALESSGPVSKGTPITLQSKFSWASAKSAVLLEWSFSIDGEIVDEGIELLGWDQERRTIRSNMQTKSGGQDQGTWTCDGTILTWTGNGFDAAGSPTTGSVRFVKTDDDTFTWQLIESTVNGSPAPDSAPYINHRVK